MPLSENLKVLTTTARILFDLTTVLNKSEFEPFEVGCKCKTEDIRTHLYNVLTLIFKDMPEISVIIKNVNDDIIVCVIRNIETIKNEII